MRGIFLLMLLILAVIAPVSASPFVPADQITLVTHLESGFSLPETSQVFVNISLFPKTTMTQHTNPSIVLSEQDFQITNQDQNNVAGYWNTNDAAFSVDTLITTTAFRKALKGEPYPLQRVPNDVTRYLVPTEFITSEDIQIQALSHQLTKDQNSLPETVHNIASWVRDNINYNLSTLTEDASQNASWVVQNKQGVCDELTVLFLALTRSAGIPSRYVTGFVYTENEETSQWISHAWAEVYFPNNGWVPYDLTFGQFGWLDASHVVAKISDTVEAPAVSFTWKSKDELTLKPLHISAEVIEQKNTETSPLKMQVTPLLHGVAAESIVPIKVQVENPTNTFQAATIMLKKSPQLLNKAIQPILLKPNSVLEFYYLVKVSTVREEYKTVIQVEDSYGKTTQSELQISEFFPRITRDAANTLIAADAYPKTKISPVSIWKRVSDYFS